MPTDTISRNTEAGTTYRIVNPYDTTMSCFSRSTRGIGG